MAIFVDNKALYGSWYVVAESTDIAPGPIAVRLLGEDIVLWRSSDGTLCVSLDRCPHREAPLSIGEVSNGQLSCAYHGWVFGDGGQCVGVPSSGPNSTVPPTAHLDVMAVQEKYGLVWVCPSEPSASIPEIPQEQDPAFRRINSGVDVWKVSTTRMVDNFLDVSHFPYVHTGTFGGAQPPTVPKIELEQLDRDFFGYKYEVDAANPDEAATASGSDDDVVHRHMTTGFSLPFTVRSTVRYAHGLEHIILLISTPVDDTTSLFTFIIWRNDDHSLDPEETIAFDRAIGAEDKRMLELVPGVLPLGRLGVVNVQSDRPSVEWRRQLAAVLGIK